MAFRRRFIFWLVKAYLKKSWKIILLFFVLGLGTFFLIILTSQYFTRILPVFSKQSIGVVGAYRQTNLPNIITNKFSRGLTAVNPDGSITPDLAERWEIKDNEKTYIFHLKQNEYFSNGKKVTAEDITYNFSDVSVERPDDYTIIFKLQDVYAPFLITVSKGVFGDGNVGVGDYKIENISLNGDFVQSLTMVSVKNRFDTITYHFYPSEESLKLAFLLGEISQAVGLTNPLYNDIDLSTLPNASGERLTNDSRLVTLFFNTTDSLLSDKILRIALSYALPDSYERGQKTYLPYSPGSLYYNTTVQERDQDFEHAQGLLESAPAASESAQLSFTIKTMKQYKETANLIAASWNKIGVKTNIEEVDRVPDHFQIFLGDFVLSRDPDQYTLWHSGQNNNITQYKNLRIDKLLEDGRKTIDQNKRREIYMDFQRFLMEDAPAAFLYFPYEYVVTRK